MGVDLMVNENLFGNRTLSGGSNIFTEKAILHKYGRLVLYYQSLTGTLILSRCDRFIEDCRRRWISKMLLFHHWYNHYCYHYHRCHCYSSTTDIPAVDEKCNESEAKLRGRVSHSEVQHLIMVSKAVLILVQCTVIADHIKCYPALQLW